MSYLVDPQHVTPLPETLGSDVIALHKVGLLSTFWF